MNYTLTTIPNNERIWYSLRDWDNDRYERDCKRSKDEIADCLKSIGKWEGKLWTTAPHLHKYLRHNIEQEKKRLKKARARLNNLYYTRHHIEPASKQAEVVEG